MNRTTLRFGSPRGAWRRPVAILCVALIATGDSVLFAQQAAPTAGESPKIPNDQLDSLVAPIALYPDPLLSQTLVASTYPLEIVQLHQWIEKNSKLKPKEISDAVKKQDWDPSIQAMAVFPDVVKNMHENIRWTADLGNAFLAQQSDVMDAVQRMRGKAKDAGHLKTTQQQTVETKVVESKTVVVIEPSSPEVVYVPSYDPMMVWGAAPYPYPPVYYPTGAYVAAGVVSFGVGLAIGAAWGGGGWGWNSGWGGGNNNININNNNNFVSHYNNKQGIRGGDRSAAGGNQWRHNPQHRGGAPYGDRNTAQRFGGSARGDSPAAKQSAARQNSGSRQTGAANRMAGGRDAGDRGAGWRGSGGAGAGGDRVGNRETSRGSGGRDSAFSGASSGMSGRSARSSSQRGASSMGGMSRGGGGGMRGGGGGRRR